MKREIVIKALLKASEDPLELSELLKKHRNSTDSFNIAEFLQALPKKDHSVIWRTLEVVTEKCLLEMVQESSEVNDEAPTPDKQKQPQCLSVMEAIVEFVGAALELEEVPCQTSIRSILQQLHEVLLMSLGEVPEIQNKACCLLEAWWLGEREGREDVVPNLLLYLIARSLEEKAKVVDVKRVWETRKALMLLDFEDPQTTPFKELLLSCTTRDIYLKTDEGRRFLSFLFGMHPKFVEDLHQIFKNQIPQASKIHVEVFAEIYFRAWRLSSGPYLKQLEEHCLQDLMFSAVHAPRTGPGALFHTLKIFLKYIHGKRAQMGVAKMLLRLYSPFLWRSLKVAHPHVRANATTLMLDTFPLQDPDATREVTNTLLQKQFDAMMDLLVDQSVLVRVTAITGVCRVLSLYFDLVPFPVLKELLGKLVKELAWDAASADVRVAVVQGLCVVLENRLSHAIMKDLLPLLHPLLHDNSEKVRLAFLELLVLVKGMKSLKFWHISSIDDLLARMEMDSTHVVKRIVALMVDAFKPSSSQMVQRCLSLLRLNVGATRRFYQLAAAHLPPGEVVRLILALQAALVQLIRDDGASTTAGTAVRILKFFIDQDESGDDVHKRRGAGALPAVWRAKSPPLSDSEGLLGSAGGNDNDVDNEAESDGEEGVVPMDRRTQCGLLEVSVVLWEEIEDKLTKKTHSKLRKRLVSRTEKNLPVFLEALTDATSQVTLYLLASHLPESSVPQMVESALQMLRSGMGTLSSRSYDHTHLVVALVSWKRMDDLLGIVEDGLRPLLEEGSREVRGVAENPQPRRKTSRRGQGGTRKKKARPGISQESGVTQPSLALSMLSWMISHPVCMKEMKDKEKFWALRDILYQSMGLLEKYFTAKESLQACVTFDLLRQSLTLYVRVSMHRWAGEEEGAQGEGQEAWFSKEMRSLMRWSEENLVTIMSQKASSSTSSSSSTRRSTRKRRASQSRSQDTVETTPPVERVKAEHLASDMLGHLSDMILTGLTRGLGLDTDMATVGSKMAGSGCGLALLPSLCKLLYQLCESSSLQELSGIAPGPGALAPTAVLLEALLSLLAQASINEPPAVYNKAWSQVRQCVSAIMVVSLRVSSLSLTPQSLQTFSVLVKSLLEAQAQHIRANTNLQTPSSIEDLPVFVASLLKIICKDKKSARLFGYHLHEHLSECDGDVLQLLLTHLASLYLLHMLSRGKPGVEEFVKPVRCTLKMLTELSDEQREKWSDVVSQTKQGVESLQHKIYST